MSLRLPINPQDHISGQVNAPIELVEYGDYQCPYCGRAYYEVKKIQERLGKELKFVFRNFPLTEAHEYALHAAIAAEVAGEMGDFWQMHDILFENQESLTDSDLINYAEELGLDIRSFEARFSESKFEEKIDKDVESGLRSGVNGTPSFFVNGNKYEGGYTAEAFIEYFRNL